MRYTEDPVIDANIKKLITRSEIGMKTYGKPMTRSDFTSVDWIDNTIEELLDAANYLEALKRRIVSG